MKGIDEISVAENLATEVEGEGKLSLEDMVTAIYAKLFTPEAPAESGNINVEVTEEPDPVDEDIKDEKEN